MDVVGPVLLIIFVEDHLSARTFGGEDETVISGLTIGNGEGVVPFLCFIRDDCVADSAVRRIDFRGDERGQTGILRRSVERGIDADVVR